MKFVQDMLRWTVVGAVFVLPFVPFIVADGQMFPNLFFPYITAKNFAFRILVEIMAAAWLALALVLPQYRPRRSWVMGAFALFVLAIGIADLFGAYPGKSIWSNFERMEGWITLAHLLAYLVVATSVLNTEKIWRRLFQVSLVASMLLAINGVMQIIGVAALGQGGVGGLSARIDATFGNPIYLAAYMLFHIFLAAMLWTQMRKVRPAKDHLWPAIFYCGAIIMDTIALLFTGTRGAMLGLIGGALLTFILLSFSHGAKKWRVITVSFFAALIVLGGIVWVARDSAVVRSIVFLDRLASISLTDNTTKARFFNMGMAWQGVKERPLLGWGQENYALVFDKYYDPRMYAQEQWFDRVHNSVFDWWIAGGTLGLLAFLGVFAAALLVLWRPSAERGSTELSRANARSVFGLGGKEAFTHEERSILTGLLAAYFAHNLTVFDNITSSILFATVLGYIAYREIAARDAAPIIRATIIPQGALGLVGAGSGILAIFLIWSINANAYTANKTLIAGIQGQPGGVAQNLELLKRAISYQSLGTQEAREQLAQITMSILASDQVPADVKAQFAQTAVSELDKQAAASPLDARHPLFAAGVLDAAGLYKEAAVYYQRARELSPGKQSILYQMGQNALLQGDEESAVKYLAEAYNLEKSNFTAAQYLASMYYMIGDQAAARRTLEEAAAVNPSRKADADKLIGDIESGKLKP
ncbi:MAG TPA: O-antigen ligase family protein [Candidatus Paceibacterota bacterium]